MSIILYSEAMPQEEITKHTFFLLRIVSSNYSKNETDFVSKSI